MIYDISYKTLIGSKYLRIRFDKIDGIIRTYDGIKCLTLFEQWIRYVVSVITYTYCHYFAKIKVHSYDSLPIEKI